MRSNGYNARHTRNVLVGEPCANIDYKYGPYSSVQEAFDELSDMEVLAIGLTVGIMTDSGIVEYWFKSACSKSTDLVLKCNNDVSESNQNNNLATVNEDGFFVSDDNGNVGMSYTSKGLDASKVTNHFVEILKQSGIGAGLLPELYIEVNEDGLFFVDDQLNIGVKIDKEGIHSKNIMEFEIVKQ